MTEPNDVVVLSGTRTAIGEEAFAADVERDPGRPDLALRTDEPLRQGMSPTIAPAVAACVRMSNSVWPVRIRTPLPCAIAAASAGRQPLGRRLSWGAKLASFYTDVKEM